MLPLVSEGIGSCLLLSTPLDELKRRLLVAEEQDLDRHLHFDSLVRLVSNYFEVRILKIINVLLLWIDLESGKGPRFPLQLLFQSIHMIQVDMGITNGVNKIASFSAGCLSHHVSQESIGGDIERHTQTHIGTALVHLTRDFVLDRVDLTRRAKERGRK